MATETTPPGLLSVLRLAISDPGSVTERRIDGEWDGTPYHETHARWQARAAAEAVRPFLAGPTPDGQVPLSLDAEQWDLAIDALQQVADEEDDPVRGQLASDLAVLLRVKIDRLVPGTYGGCDD
ncbi:MAG TPA: hypothetical protein VIZ43_08390 [Trebonia sp.]